MAVLPRDLADEPHTLTPEEFDLLLDQRARRSLGMSLDEFLRARDAGSLPDIPAVDHLLLLVRARTRPDA